MPRIEEYTSQKLISHFWRVALEEAGRIFDREAE